LIKGIALSVKSLFIIGAGSNHPHALSQSTFPKPAIVREGDTKNKKQKTDMKKLIMKLLGLENIVETVDDMASYTSQLPSAEEINKLLERVKELEEKVSEIEVPDLDEYVREDDVNDRIESYLNDNDYVTQSYCDDEIETKVSDAVDEKVTDAIDELDISDKVEEVVKGMDKASFGDTEELNSLIRAVIRNGKIKFE
jgi:hypothetical protein